ncbi:MAG: rhodanese-like domain-containing protein [Acidimicrobiia bacterium]
MLFRRSGIDVATAHQRQGDGVMLIDVRSKNEWRSGHVPGATHVSLESLPQRIEWLRKAAADTEVMVICRSGNRSAQATKQLSAAGVGAVNVRGGMVAWERVGLPVKKGS